MPRRNLLALFVTLAVCLVSWMAREASPYGRRFGDVLSTIENLYLKPVNEQALFESAVNGVMATLDEHSSFIDASGRSDFETLLNQEFVGIGLQLELNSDRSGLTVLSPIVGSPSWKSGIQQGDQITRIDGKSTADMTLKQAVELLRGQRGTSVRLDVVSHSSPTPREIVLERDRIKVESVLGDRRRPDGTWDWRLEGRPDIAFVRIRSFGDHTAADFELAIEHIENGPATEKELAGLVIDLRDDPGGLITAAVDVCDLFLNNGLIVSTRGRSTGNLTKERLATAGSCLEGVPIAILVDSQTASAAEIVAACLQDHSRATVIGSRTFGKGTVQNVVPLWDGEGLLKLTTAEYLRPSNVNIHRNINDGDNDPWGVTPNPECELTPSGEVLEKLAQWRRLRDCVPPRQETDFIPTKDPESKGGASSFADLPEKVDPVLNRAISWITQKQSSSQHEN